MTTGRLRRVMFLAKGSLFLGRMTQMSDGLSFILERNPAG
jgi:betaine reductase